jgi:uncharacterized protein with GYD domain
MPKYLFRAKLLPDGVAQIMREGATVRRNTIAQRLESLGGTLDSLHFAIDDGNEIVGICELPDHRSATAFALGPSASGKASVSATALLTAEEMDEACKAGAHRPTRS